MPETLAHQPHAPEETRPARPDRPPRRSTAALLWGIALIVLGVLWLGEMVGLDVPWAALAPAAVVVIGLALMIAAWTGTHGGLIALGVVLTFVSAVSVTFEGPFTVGDRTHRPASVEELPEAYELGIGSLVVDLRDIEFPMDRTELEVRLNIGDLRILLPDEVIVEVDSSLGIGDLRVLGRHESGVGPNLQLFDDPPGDQGSIVLVTDVGIGNVEVER